MKFVSTGISISSINRIKELAEQKKFKEALEILDTQNLDKSINPQFLRISGEIFRENKRYYDSRRVLLKAHQMAPQGNRIIYELIQLYLELGYYTKAQKYYEQYMFYTTPEDTQRDYVEYIMKKATGTDVKELASILIPILERMPEDRWNFEAILLYHKMNRKDMALEESRYILENFKDSEYVQPVIDYIDDKLNIEQWFYIYPQEEQPEDEELFGELIVQEEKILERDYLRMYPPEAKIMVEADDHDAIDTIPTKEKKTKKKFGKKAKKKIIKESSQSGLEGNIEEKVSETTEVDKPIENKNSLDLEAIEEEVKLSAKDEQIESQLDEAKSDRGINNGEHLLEASDVSDKELTLSIRDEESVFNEEQMRKKREDALEKILSKKLDKDKIKESAKQVAKAMKEMDADKAKKQVQSVAETVKENVKKATSALSGAVGTKLDIDESEVNAVEQGISDEELILDGIIESVLEPPKKAVGQVVMNEELDALIPDSLEAMSEKEIADIEAKKDEIERLELEALEATLKLEEEKKEKKRSWMKNEEVLRHTVEEETEKSSSNKVSETEEMLPQNLSVHGDKKQQTETVSHDTEKKLSDEQEYSDTQTNSDSVKTYDKETLSGTVGENMYSQLRCRFMEELEREKPLESLGFITVVHSDVDALLEDEVPDAAGVLHQMIDNKEFYSGENSLGFETETSYENHGFEVENYDFEAYMSQQEQQGTQMIEEVQTEVEEDSADLQAAVQVIFAEESVVAFEDVSVATGHADSSIADSMSEDTIVAEPITDVQKLDCEPAEKTVLLEENIPIEVLSNNELSFSIETDACEREVLQEKLAYRVPVDREASTVQEDRIQNTLSSNTYEEKTDKKREYLRADIVISTRMENMLVELKESR